MRVCRRSASGRLLPMPITKTHRLRRCWKVELFVLYGSMRDAASPTRTPTSVWVTLSIGVGDPRSRASGCRLQPTGWSALKVRPAGSLLVRHSALRGADGVAAGAAWCLLPAAHGCHAG